MKNLFTLFIIFFSFLAKADSWIQKADYGGGMITAATGFSIGAKGYIGFGTFFSTMTTQFWEYEPTGNTWTQMADFPDNARQGASGFSIGNKGYVGLGWDPNFRNNFWEYDPALNQWTQKADFIGSARMAASCFSINNKGYIGCGLSAAGPETDFFEYDPISDVWTQKASPSFFNGIYGAVSFVINDKGYITTGSSTNSTQEYDPISNTWANKAACPLIGYATSGFAIGNRGYVGTGIIDQLSGTTKDFWQYNPDADTWLQKTPFAGLGRRSAIAFAIGNKGYMGTGDSQTDGIFSDFWEYIADPTGIEELPNANLQFTISPNPVKELLVISSPLRGKEKINLTISDVNGKKILQTQPAITNNQSTISLKSFSKGIYFVEVNDGKQKAVKKFLKE